MATAHAQPLSAEEYLAIERQSETRHELIDGEIIAMSGAKLRNIIVTGNIYSALRSRLRNSGCLPVATDLRLHVPSRNNYFYPDVFVACAEDLDLDDDNLNDAVVVFEVLSPTTEFYDRGVKFENYGELPSLDAYVIVAPERVRVEIYERNDQGWQYTAYTHLENELPLRKLNTSLPLAEIYEGVTLP